MEDVDTLPSRENAYPTDILSQLRDFFFLPNTENTFNFRMFLEEMMFLGFQVPRIGHMRWCQVEALLGE